MSNLEERSLLKERGTRYGDYLQQTIIIENIMAQVYEAGYGQAYRELQPDQKDAIRMIVVKLSRILNGDPNYLDNWQDIAGYATLVAERLEREDV